MLDNITQYTPTQPLVAKAAKALRRSKSTSDLSSLRAGEPLAFLPPLSLGTTSGTSTPISGLLTPKSGTSTPKSGTLSFKSGSSNTDWFESPKSNGLNGALRARISGDIMAIDANYKANFSHMGRRGARTGMLVGAIVGTVIGITLAALSFGVGIPLIGIVVGIGGQIVGFFVGLAIERFMQWRFARKHPEIIDRLRLDAKQVREDILQAAQGDRSYDPENDLRSLDLFLHNLNGTAGKALLELFSGLFRESPGVVFEVVRDVRHATESGIKRVPKMLKRVTGSLETPVKAQ